MENEDYKNSILIAEELVKEVCEKKNSQSLLFKEWKVKNPELYEQMSAQKEWVDKITFYNQVDITTARQNIRNRLFLNNRRTLFVRIGSIAALVIVLLAIGAFMFLRGETQLKEEGVPLWAKTIPGNERATIITSDNQAVQLNNPVLVVQKNQIINGKGDGSIQIAIRNEQKTQLNKLDVPPGGEHSLTLADGSLVKVNSATELWFPTDFGKKTRQVQLQGEAYFQVEQDQEHPFIVNLTHDIKIRVTGTTFNVNAYKEEDEINVALVEGSVDILRGTELLTSLIPGQIFSYHKESSQYKVNQTGDVTHMTDWTSDIFVFRDEPIARIMRKLSRWYNVDINVHNEIKDVRYTGILNRKQPLNETLDALRMTGELDFEIQRDKKVNIIDTGK